MIDDKDRLAQMLADLARIRKLLRESDLQAEHVDKRLERSEDRLPNEHVCPDDAKGGAGREPSDRLLANRSDQP